jgi:hypothetical protein
MATVTPPTTTEERWLTCRITKGMFSNERVVTYPAEGEKQTSVFVPATAVEGSPGERGRVRVRIGRLNGHLMAVLPSEYSDLVTVQEADVSPI